MRDLILYSTLGCHLCELALDEVQPCIANTDWHIKEVDIADDPALLEAYGTSIPVLFIPEQEQKLYWPFDRLAVQDLLSKV